MYGKTKRSVVMLCEVVCRSVRYSIAFAVGWSQLEFSKILHSIAFEVFYGIV